MTMPVTAFDHPLRVTTLVDSLTSGTAERVAIEVACNLDRTRFTPHVLVTNGDGPLVELLESHDVAHTVLNRADPLDLAALRAARRHLIEHADLLHAHAFGPNAFGALLARMVRIPFVAHEHTVSEHPTRARRRNRRWIARRAARVLCVSDSVAQIERSCGVPERLLAVVPTGVHVDAAWPRGAARAELGLVDRSFTIGIVSRLLPDRNHELLLHAVARLATAGRDVRLCVVGDGPSSGQLQLLAGTLGIGSRVTWAGHHRNAAQLASAFDVNVVCSRRDGLPLAALESLAAGVPLIAPRVGALAELLDGAAGQLVPPADIDALTAAITALIDNPDRSRRLASAGLARVRERHSFEAMVRNIETIYHDVAIASAHSARSSRRRVQLRAPRSTTRQEAA